MCTCGHLCVVNRGRGLNKVMALISFIKVVNGKEL